MGYDSYIYSLYQDIEKCNKLISAMSGVKGPLAALIPSLSNESTRLVSIANTVRSCYTIDEVAINKKIINNKGDVDSVIESINSILSTIDSNISKYKSQIQNDYYWIDYYYAMLEAEAAAAAESSGDK
jgi:ribosome-associated translation inhibitor RaiA